MEHHIILPHVGHSYRLHQAAVVHHQPNQILQPPAAVDICIRAFQITQVHRVLQPIQVVEVITLIHMAAETEIRQHQTHTIHSAIEIEIRMTTVTVTATRTEAEIHMMTETKVHHPVARLHLVIFSASCGVAAVAVVVVAIATETAALVARVCFSIIPLLLII